MEQLATLALADPILTIKYYFVVLMSIGPPVMPPWPPIPPAPPIA